MRFKAVAFDVDGTLYPASALNIRAASLVARHPIVFAAFARVRRDIRTAARGEKYRLSPPADGPAFRRLQAEMAAPMLDPLFLGGGRVDRVESRIAETAYRDVAELFSSLSPYPGLVPALDALSGAGLRVAALSDLPPLRKLDLLGLAGRFEVALCSEDSGFLKPAPEPFRMLCAALGLPPGEVLYVGNSAAYDLAGARAAGMRAAIVSRRRLPGADLSFFDWRDLVAYACA